MRKLGLKMEYCSYCLTQIRHVKDDVETTMDSVISGWKLTAVWSGLRDVHEKKKKAYDIITVCL